MSDNANKLIQKITHAHSTPVTTAAYTELDAALDSDVKAMEIFDNSGETLILAYGAAGSEVVHLYIMPGGNGRIPIHFPKGVRLAVKAVSADTASGNLYINVWG